MIKIRQGLILLFLGLFLLSTVKAKSLSVQEERIIDYVNQHLSEQLTLLEKLVNINSGTMNMLGVREVGQILKSELEQIDFHTYWVEEPADMHRAGTLVAEHKGNGKGQRILLISHLDTVFPKESKFQKFKRRDQVASGPGVIDAKGGDVIILYALKALKASHALEDATITIVLTGDEEDSGKPTNISRKPLFDAAKQSDIALDFEWSISKDTATVARRGITGWVLETEGKEAHSSKIFEQSVGYGANFELTRILESMRSQLAGKQNLTFNPGRIFGGSTIQNEGDSQVLVFGKDNVIAKTAGATGDLRFLNSGQKLQAEQQMTAIVKQHLVGTTASIHFEDEIPAMPPSRGNMALLKKYSEISEYLGYGEVKALDPGLRGAGDISHIATKVSANLAGLGALGTGAHSPEETLEINSLAMQTKRAALLIYRLSH